MSPKGPGGRPAHINPWHLQLYVYVEQLRRGPEKLTIPRAIQRLRSRDGPWKEIRFEDVRKSYDTARKNPRIRRAADQALAGQPPKLNLAELSRGYDVDDALGRALSIAVENEEETPK